MSAATPCWPYGYATRDGDCDQTIPDTSDETMTRFGWGFVLAGDPGSESGLGHFFACPHHRDDCVEEQREMFVRRCAEANAAPSSSPPVVSEAGQ